MINEEAYKAALEKYASLTGAQNTPSLRHAIEAYLQHAYKHSDQFREVTNMVHILHEPTGPSKCPSVFSTQNNDSLGSPMKYTDGSYSREYEEYSPEFIEKLKNLESSATDKVPADKEEFIAWLDSPLPNREDK